MSLRERSWLCVIPARGGSKGLKDKNIRMLDGKPLIAWAIEAAKNSGIHDDIIVSTDSERIADVARDWGATVQMRPAHLASDTAQVMDTMQYVCQNVGRKYDYVQLLEPTSPLVEGDDILLAARTLQLNDWSFLISVCESDVPLGVAKPIPESGRLTNWFPYELRHKNRQEITQTYQLDGNLYMGKWHVFENKIDYWDTEIFAWKMPKDKHCHVDDELDLKVAAYKIGIQNERKKSRTLRGFIEKCFTGRAR